MIKRVMHGIIRQLDLIVSDFVMLRLFADKKLEREQAKDAIILLRLDAIGDFILWMDAAKIFRQIYQDKQIILLCQPINEELAQSIGYFDKVIGVNLQWFISNSGYRNAIVEKISSYRCSMLIQNVYSRSLAMDVIASQIPAAKKITIKSDFSSRSKIFKRRSDAVYDEIIDTPLQTMMELRRNTVIVSHLLKRPVKAHIASLPTLARLPDELSENKYFIVFPGGSHQSKLWPVERFAALAKYCCDVYKLSCCICGSDDEKPLAEEIKKHISKNYLIDMAGKTTIPQLVEVIRNSAFLIGNDTSSVHIAAAVSTRAFCIVGGWHFNRFLPYDLDDSEQYKLPVPLFRHIRCYNCGKKWYKKSFRCFWVNHSNNKFPCIDIVDLGFVKKRIEECLNENQKF